MPDDTPFLRVLSGAPDEAELAAVTVALLSLAGGAWQRRRPAVEPARWSRREYRAPGAWDSG